MKRRDIAERPNWREKAREYDFVFHTEDDIPYWDESAYYEFSLRQIEDDIEDPTAELHQMFLEVVDTVASDCEWLRRFRVPEAHWDFIQSSWKRREPSLYSRIDLAYAGQGPAKLFENNADTPTSVFETGFWQWLWLEDNIEAGTLPKDADQFNSLHDKLVARFGVLPRPASGDPLYFSCCKETPEDRGTVQYLMDCAEEAGLPTSFVYVEDIGRDADGKFTDLDDQIITRMFKLYPWEFMHVEEFGAHLTSAEVSWLEPPWKALLSNKALLPALWKLFPQHPNLLPAYFEEDLARAQEHRLVKKPFFSREGANVSILENRQVISASPGPYGAEGYIYQELFPLPRFNNYYALLGSWLVNDQPAGMSVREDESPITQDCSRFIPHVIL